MASSLFDVFGDAIRQSGEAFARVLKNDFNQGNQVPMPSIHVDASSSPAVGVVPLVCPKCGASVQQGDDQEVTFCSYCGTRLLVDDGTAEVTYRTVDETRIRELEIEEAREMRRQELAEKRRPGKIKATIVLAIIGAVMMLGGQFIGDASGDPNSSWYLVAMLGMFPLVAIVFIWVPLFDRRDDG